MRRPQPAEVAPAELPAPLIGGGLLLVAAALAVCGVWAAALWLSVHVRADETLHSVALFAHLSALVVGFGAVLVVDWCGLLWALGRRPLTEVLALAQTCHAVIWLGLVGLTLSGALLAPDLAALRTQVKLAAVLLLGLNGVQAFSLHAQLQAAPGPLPGRLLRRAAATAVISQAGWWTATVIGFLTHQSR